MVKKSIAPAWLLVIVSGCGLTSEESQAQQECEDYYGKVLTWLPDQDVPVPHSLKKSVWNFYSRLNRQLPLGHDPWGQRYRYIFDLSRGVVHVCSDGPDGQSETSDDIVFPELDR